MLRCSRAATSTTDGLVASMADLLGSPGYQRSSSRPRERLDADPRRSCAWRQPDRLVEDGDELLDLPGWDLRTVWTPGHSPGHLCFHSPSAAPRALRRPRPAADHPQYRRATPADPESARRLPRLAREGRAPRVRRGAPGARVAVLGARGARRTSCAATTEPGSTRSSALEADDGLTCWELTLRLTWSRSFELSSSFIQRAASGETLAHLVLLESQGTVVRTRLAGAVPAGCRPVQPVAT